MSRGVRRAGVRLACLPALVAATISPAAQEAPRFRSGVELVTIDATVVGPDGQPVSTLGPDDFELRVDGRPRRVATAQFVSAGAAERRDLAALPRHFSSNEFAAPGRLMVLAVDEAHIRRTEGRAALRAAGAFLDTLPPSDRVAVVGLTSLGSLEFTADRRAQQRRLERLTGQADPVFLQFNIGLIEAVEIADGGRARLADVVLRECGRALTEYLNLARADDVAGGRDACPEQVEQEARAVAQHARTQARITISALEALVAALGNLEGPKTLVLLSEGLVADPRLMNFAEFSLAAQQARVTVYVLQMEQPLFEAATDRVSPTILADFRMREDGLTRLAGAARGTVFRLLGGDPRPFERIATELSGHYLVAFEPAPGERDGRVHRLELSVAGGKGTVRARQAFRLPDARPSPQAREQELVALLRSPQAVTELPLRLATHSYMDPASRHMRVVVTAEADAAGGADPLLGYVLVDGAGVVVASGAERAPGGRHAFTARLAPGVYTLRAAGIDALNRRGLVERRFTAALAAQKGITVSDLMLAPPPRDHTAPLDPLVDRADASTLTAYLEIYAAGATLPSDLAVSLELTASERHTRAYAVDATLTRHGSRWAVARAVLPVDDLPAGAYTAVARITQDGVEIGQAIRPLTLSGRPSR